MPGQCRCSFLQNTALKNEFPPKRAKTEPRGCKITQTWPYMAPKGTQFEPKGHQNDPKGCQRGAKSEPEINKNTTKDRYVKKGRKKGCAATSFWLIFDLFLVKKRVKKSMRKTMPKKASKITKFKQKARYGSIPRNAFSHRLSAKAVPAK